MNGAAPPPILLDQRAHSSDYGKMADVFNYRAEIKKLEDQKWDILLRHGEAVAIQRWVAIDERLNQLYWWLTRELIVKGRERELPFHRRKLT